MQTDYLVDDGTECHSTSDILLERNREQSLVDVLVPCLLLLNTLLLKLQVQHPYYCVFCYLRPCVCDVALW